MLCFRSGIGNINVIEMNMKHMNENDNNNKLKHYWMKGFNQVSLLDKCGIDKYIK
jgi:hypothetical protein